MFQKIIGLFLHVANSSPPFLYRQEFYKLKERLLGKYGTFLGYELQHIKKICWTCGGTGIYQHNGYDEDCRRCINGVYEEFWVVLRKYSISKYQFHIPEKKIYANWGMTTWVDLVCMYHTPVTIEGYIQHRSYGHLSDECFYWLALLFDLKLFFRCFGRIRYIGKKYTPMMFSNNAIFNIKRLYAMACGCVGRFMLRPGHDREELPF